VHVEPGTVNVHAVDEIAIDELKVILAPDRVVKVVRGLQADRDKGNNRRRPERAVSYPRQAKSDAAGVVASISAQFPSRKPMSRIPNFRHS
jgi:hypothetical protein